MQKLMYWFSRHPRRTLVTIGILSLLALIPLRNVRIETSVKSMMDQHDPARQFYQETRDLFGTEAIALIYIEDRDLFSFRKLDALQSLIFDLEGLVGIESAISLFTLTDITLSDDLLDARPLLDLPPTTQEEADRLRTRATQHPIARRLFVSQEGDATAIHLRLDMHNGHDDQMIALAERIEDTLSAYAGAFERLDQTGRPYIIERQSAYIARDQKVMLPLAVGVLLIMLTFMLSSFKGATLPLLTSGVSILWTLAFMGLFHIPVTVLSFMVPSLIIVIGSTEDIHLLAEYHEGRIRGMAPKAAIHRMIQRLAVAVTFTAVTTLLGFASIATSTIPLLKQFGWVASFGLFVNPLITISLLPAVLALLSDRSVLMKKNKPHRIFFIIPSIVSRLRRRPRLLLAATCLPCLAFGIYGFMQVEADNNIIGYFKPDSPIVKRADRLTEKLAGVESFCIRLDADHEGAFKEPENLSYALRLQDYMEQSGWIDRSISLTDYLRHIHQALTGSAEPLPESRNGVAEYLLLLHQSEIEPYATPDFRHLNIIVRHNVRSSKKLMPRIGELQQFIDRTCPPRLTAAVTGEGILVNRAVYTIISGQVRSIFIIACFAALLLSILFKSFRFGIIGLIPNLLPIGIQFGMMALLDIPLNVATSMAAAVCIGLAVDDTIHLLIRFKSRHAELPPEEAVESALRHMVKPIVTTSVSLSLGFLVMRFSLFKPIGDFALLSAIMLTTALLADLLVTPTLLTVFTQPGATPEKSRIP
ncbi:RND family transporter [Pontiella sp.]|uniref:efflux RND transporter permease subunit n=1 Tax=Pontiella sp. TaxID=2837462 RepID=UPI0035620582